MTARNMVEAVEQFLVEATDLLKDLRGNKSAYISKKKIRNKASQTSKKWLQHISPGLRGTTNLADDVLNSLDSKFERSIELANSNNRKGTYIKLLSPLPKEIQRDVLIPLIKATPGTSLLDGASAKVFSLTRSPEEKQYFEEAFRAAKAGCYKAATVMSWCAAVDRLQSVVKKHSLARFNQASKTLKAQTTGFYKWFSKEFNFTLDSDLQEVADKDLITVISGMVSLDHDVTRKIWVLLDTRNSCAHPSSYAIEELSFVHFTNEICNLVLGNPKLS